MMALLEPEVDLWVRCLNDAMRGWGTDENSLSALVFPSCFGQDVSLLLRKKRLA